MPPHAITATSARQNASTNSNQWSANMPTANERIASTGPSAATWRPRPSAPDASRVSSAVRETRRNECGSRGASGTTT